MEEVKPFELRSFEDEARLLVEAARTRAREMLRAALGERDRVREEARREGYEAGLAEGRVAALAEERGRLAAEAAAVRDLLGRLAASVEAKRAELIAAAEHELVRLALVVAAKVTQQEIRKKKTIAPANVKKAIERLARRHSLQVLVHPADLEAIEKFVPELRRQFADITELKLEASEGVGKGGCLVVTREGKVDATLENQLKEVARGFLE